ncbi:MAG: exodeoxyribonuclease V subunit alpha, partial [Paracoccus sp. (in: a-proteobacteria)]
LGAGPELVLGAALTCFELGRGHVCLPLNLLTSQGGWRPFGLDPEQSRDLLGDLADPALWPGLFATSPLVGLEENDGEAPRWPLRLWQERLYLTRYHDFEQGVARHLGALSEQAEWPEIAPTLSRLFARDDALIFSALLEARLAPDFSAPQFVEKYLDLIFPGEVNWPEVEALLARAQAASDLAALDALVPEALCCNGQKLAAATAAARPFAVISGGPGTGKTTTVVRLLAALLEQPGGERLAIGLAAPTGKAAARMAEAIRNAKASLPLADELKALLPEEARTLHRLLGSRGDSPAVRHDAARPLALDVLVVDEASMVDLALMAKLVDALPPQARLILLGDKDQLAAVEAGAVFAELCEGRGFDAAAAAELQRITGQSVPVEAPCSALGDAVVLLTHSHRFAGDSGIGELARRSNAGDAAGTLNLLRENRPDLAWQAEPTQTALLARLEQGYLPYLQAARRGEPAEAFAAFNSFRALTAQREGPWGVGGINEALEARIKRRFSLPERERWYPGRAVMVRQNDYALGLFNGDIGICLACEYGLRV